MLQAADVGFGLGHQQAPGQPVGEDGPQESRKLLPHVCIEVRFHVLFRLHRRHPALAYPHGEVFGRDRRVGQALAVVRLALEGIIGNELPGAAALRLLRHFQPAIRRVWVAHQKSVLLVVNDHGDIGQPPAGPDRLAQRLAQVDGLGQAGLFYVREMVCHLGMGRQAAVAQRRNAHQGRTQQRQADDGKEDDPPKAFFHAIAPLCASMRYFLAVKSRPSPRSRRRCSARRCSECVSTEKPGTSQGTAFKLINDATIILDQ